MSPFPRSLCLVANDLDYLMRNGGIGTYNWLLAHLLAARGWRVHVLYCGNQVGSRASASVTRRLQESGIGFSNLDDFAGPHAHQVYPASNSPRVHASDKIRHALEDLHRLHHFHLVEFAEWEGFGFRSIQARRAGLAFQDVRMIVKLHSSSQWMREGNHHWSGHCDDLELDYCERYTFENADVQMSPSRYMLDYVRRVGWNARADARVISNPFPRPQFLAPPAHSGPPSEIVFFGRLETRKGLEIFLEAVRHLDPTIPITFLGRETTLHNGLSAREFIRAQLKGRSYSLLPHYHREQALRYLTQSNRLAVIPSLLDNLPFTVIECLTHGIPFIAARVGGIPEIVTDPDVRSQCLFEPNARALLQCLQDSLHADAAHQHALRPGRCQAANLERMNAQVADAYEELAREPFQTACVPAFREPIPEDSPLVSVAIPFFNMGAYLPETLASLAAQTYPNFEVFVINDGSTDPGSLQVFEEQQLCYPQFQFLTQANQGIGAAQNRGLEEARGEYFITVDADNIARPDMVERFVEGMKRNPELAAMTCFFLAFEDAADLQKEEFAYAVRPTAGPHVLACFKNIYGDANAIFRTAAFRAAGGYETDRDTSSEDWEVFVKLVNAGHRVDVIPDYLFYYRHLEDGFSRITDTYCNHRRVLRQFFQIDSLPAAERIALWTALVGLMHHNHGLHVRLGALRYRLLDWLATMVKRIPLVRWLRATLVSQGRVVADTRFRPRKPALKTPRGRYRSELQTRVEQQSDSRKEERVHQRDRAREVSAGARHGLH